MSEAAAGGTLDLRPVDADTWRAVADLRVAPAQRAFVAEPSRYLALCHYDPAGWTPLAVLLDGRVIGFLMWAVDPEDDACWLGGVLIDRAWQGRGYGRRAMRAALARLTANGCRHFALAYEPDNRVARSLYASLGFRETGERDGTEVVARLALDR